MIICKQKPRVTVKQKFLSNWCQSSAHPLPNSTNSSASLWSLSIRSSTQAGRFRDVLSLYTHLHRSGQIPDNFEITAALKACSRITSRILGRSIHAQVYKYGHCSDVYSRTALVDLYSRVEGIQAAQQAFDEMPTRNVVSCNSIMAAYLKAREFDAAGKVFNEMPVRDVVSWNSMVSGYAKAGDMDRAVSLFQMMPEKNPASWNGMISANVDSGNVGAARDLFDKMPEKNNVSLVTMISGYAQYGDFVSARSIFDQMVERDLCSWNAMIACYAQNGQPGEALKLFNRMQKLNMDGHLHPNEMTFSSVISACSQLGDLRFGLWAKKYMSIVGIELDDQLRTALIDLYAKCGSMDMAFELFAELKKRDLVSYSAMILGCGMNGKACTAIDLFSKMLNDEIAPNSVTFMGLLTAYSHTGLVEEGLRCFASMWSKHRVAPSSDHYSIMVDLLGRVGRLDEAYRLISSMPMKPHVGAWGALLLACRLHGNVKLGEIAARNCFQLEPGSGGYYVLLANIYAEAGKWDESKRLRNVMAEKGLSLTPGCSRIEPG